MADDDFFNSVSPDNQDAFDDNFDGDSTLESSFSTQKKKTTQQKKRQAKPKVSSDWFDDEMFTLISRVERLPMLWNAKDEKYRNKIERQSAWKQMSENDFDNKFTTNKLMSKWSNMRIQYRSYFAKYRKNKSGQGAKEPVKWKFYGTMDFVGQAEEEQTSTTVSNLVNTDERSLDSPIDRSMTSMPSTPQISKRRRLSQSSSVTATSSSAAHIVAEGMKDAVNQLKEQRQKRENEFDAFGKYVATELRSLSNPSSAQRVRFKVARYVMDCIDFENQSSYILDETAVVLSQPQQQQND